ncbi:MAG: phage portal protein [Rhodobacteraceae bacterium]|nr:phage portal protein [Paracoccaceae bacterium]
MLRWLTRRRATETRSSGAGFTAAIMAARESYISGRSGLAELTATVQACASLWEGAFALADVTGTGLLDRRTMGLLARALAFRGEAVLLIRDRLVPCSDWDVSTRNGTPRAYRLSIPEAGGGRSETVLAPEVLHVRLAADPVAPWTGQAPLRRASLSAQLLHEVEQALHETFRDAPIGSMIVPLDGGGGEALESVRGSLRGRRGGALVVEYLSQSIAGGAPVPGRGPDHLTPRLREAAVVETLEAARGAICTAFGVLPALLNATTTGPLVREAQRHLAGWTLQPIAALVAEEACAKLGAEIEIDVMRPLQAYDAGGRARALATTVQALAQAKEGGLAPGDLAGAMALLSWGPGETAP